VATNTMTFTSSDDRASLPDDYTFTTDDAGTHTFDGLTLISAGEQSIMATDVNTAITGSGTVRVTPRGRRSLPHRGTRQSPGRQRFRPGHAASAGPRRPWSCRFDTAG